METFKGYADENNFVYDVEYEVTIKFKKNWKKEKVIKFIENNLSEEIKIISAKDKQVKLLWPLEIFSGEEEIALELYELLEAGNLGVFDYERVS